MRRKTFWPIVGQFHKLTFMLPLNQGVHSCHPILDVRDAARKVVRDTFLREHYETQTTGGMMHQKPTTSMKMIEAYMTDEQPKLSTEMITNKVHECRRQADTMNAIHWTCDMDTCILNYTTPLPINYIYT